MASFFFADDSGQQAPSTSQRRPQLVHRDTTIARETPDFLPSTSGTRRAQVCPPSLFSRSGPLWKQWAIGAWNWLWDLDEQPDPMPVLTGLCKAKSEFAAALWDLQSLPATHLRDSIDKARSLRELWHLRADVFRVISTHRGQAEATLRLDALDWHFPVRISRHDNGGRLGRTTTW